MGTASLQKTAQREHSTQPNAMEKVDAGRRSPAAFRPESAAEAPPPRKRGPEAGSACCGGGKSAPKAGPALRYLAMRFFQATERMPSRMVQGLGGQPGT